MGEEVHTDPKAPVNSLLAMRRATPAEASILLAIRREAILTLAAPAYGVGRAREWAEGSGRERIERALDLNEVWVATRGDELGGWVEIDEDRVEGLYVRPEYARIGVGSALLRHAESQIESAGHLTVALDASLNAEPFYLGRGYEALGGKPTDRGRPMRKRLGDSSP